MTLIQAIRSVENCTKAEAEEIISQMKNDVCNGADPDEVLESYGLEPDYAMDILF
jgi:hypothetical protein